MTNANGDQLALDIYCNLADVEDCICRIVCEQAKATRKLVKRCLLTNVLMAGLVLAALVSLKLLPS